MKSSRLFIALQIPSKVQKTLSGQLERFTLTSVRMRPVLPPDMHCTLKFLGETDDSHIPAIIECLEAVVPATSIFDIELGGGILLPAQKPRTIGARIIASEQLQRLYDDIVTALSERGLADQDRRRFNPHITVARIDGILSQEEQMSVLAWPCAGISCNAEQVLLIESILRPQGPLYTTLTSTQLA